MTPIYLDYQATTPTDPRVVEAMAPYWARDFGNPHSEGHSFGWKAKQAVEKARTQVANFINAYDDEVVFTSGATESCNLALRGVAPTGARTQRNRIITLSTEHPAVLETARSLAQQGYDVEVLPVMPDGTLDLDTLAIALTQETLLVSIMLANNEIGVIQPLEQISEMSHDVGALVHTDATQASGRMGVNVEELGVDFLSISGHKVYGPNGVGALYIRNIQAQKVEPIMTGGHQEKGIRPGTIPVPLVVGMGEACRIASNSLEEEASRLNALCRQLLEELQQEFPSILKFGSLEKRIPGNMNVGIPGIPGELLVEAVSSKVAISTGAACSTGSPEPSHVLMALGIEPETASTAVRISMGRFTTKEEVDQASQALRSAIKTLKSEK
jgi:cysteine desulfurase